MAFNSDEYSWRDLQVFMLGRLITGIQGVSYTLRQTKENIYAKGDKPHSRGHGNKEYDGSVTLLQSEVEAIQAELGDDEDLTDLRDMTIVVSYAPENGGVTTDELLAVEVTELPKGGSQGDTSMPSELNIVIGDINYNV